MSISKNWEAISISGIAGYELIVTGEANTGLLTVLPELKKREPQGFNPMILQLDLLNAGDANPENYQLVQYNEKLTTQGQYQSVEIFHNNKITEEVKVTKEQ